MQSREEVGRLAATGMLWGVLGSVVGKAASFVAQIYLGNVLSKADFGVYATALASASILSGLVGGGTSRILIQRGGAYRELASDVLRISWAFNLAVCALLVAAGCFVLWRFTDGTLAVLLITMGVATVISTPGPVMTARLNIDLEFGKLQRLAIWSHIVRHGSSIVCAFSGLGALSFVLPMAITATSDNVLAWRRTRPLPPMRPFARERALAILRDSKWVMLGTFAGAMILNGGNLVIGVVADRVTLGLYFFAFQITLSLAGLVGGTLQGTMVPALSRLDDSGAERAAAFRFAVRIVGWVGTLVSGIAIYCSAFVISNLWHGKWNDSILAAQILGLGIPAILLSWVARAAVESRGRWALVTILQLFEGIITMSAAALGAHFGGLTSIVIALIGAQFGAAGVQIWSACRALGCNAAATLGSSVIAPAMALCAAAIEWRAFGAGVYAADVGALHLAGAVATFVAIFAILSFLFSRSVVMQCYRMIASVI